MLKENNNNIIIMGGDFNCHLDKTAIDDRSKIDFINILKRHGLKDVLRTIHTENPGQTFYRKGLNKPSRIYYFFITSELLHQSDWAFRPWNSLPKTNPYDLEDGHVTIAS